MKELSDVIFAVSDAISVAIDAGAMPAARELQKINRELLAKDHVVGIGELNESDLLNGYNWGVEYPTNGKKPDLPDDVYVDVKCHSTKTDWKGYTDLKVSGVCWGNPNGYEVPAVSFRIIDSRYKPKQPESHSKPSTDESLLQAGDMVEVDCHHQGKRNGRVLATFQRWAWCDVDGIGIDTYDIILVKKRKSERELLIDVITSAGNLSDGMLADAIISAGWSRDNKESRS